MCWVMWAWWLTGCARRMPQTHVPTKADCRGAAMLTAAADEGGPVADWVIEDPILNRPYDEPSRHFEFDVDGITDVVAERRRPSSHFVPVPQSRKGGRQLELSELTAD